MIIFVKDQSWYQRPINPRFDVPIHLGGYQGFVNQSWIRHVDKVFSLQTGTVTMGFENIPYLVIHGNSNIYSWPVNKTFQLYIAECAGITTRSGGKV